jgi:hypothetical protein
VEKLFKFTPLDVETVFILLAGLLFILLSLKVELVLLLRGMKAVLCLPFVTVSPVKEPELLLLFVLNDL